MVNQYLEYINILQKDISIFDTIHQIKGTKD